MLFWKRPGFVRGLMCGFMAGLALAATLAGAANIGVFDRGPAKVYVYQSDTNPNLVFYDISLKNSSRATHVLAVTGTWSTAVRVEAQPK